MTTNINDSEGVRLDDSVERDRPKFEQNQHTPGPWQVHTPTEFQHHPQNQFVRDQRGWFIAEIQRLTDELKPTEEAQANARLIAAAPDLLAACKWAAENYGIDKHRHASSAKHLVFLAAIAKAEGRAE